MMALFPQHVVGCGFLLYMVYGLEWDIYTGAKGYISKTQWSNGNHIADFPTVLSFIYWNIETNDGYSGE